MPSITDFILSATLVLSNVHDLGQGPWQLQLFGVSSGEVDVWSPFGQYMKKKTTTLIYYYIVSNRHSLLPHSPSKSTCFRWRSGSRTGERSGKGRAWKASQAMAENGWFEQQLTWRKSKMQNISYFWYKSTNNTKLIIASCENYYFCA